MRELWGPAAALAAGCVERAGSFNAQDTANTWWALATLGAAGAGPGGQEGDLARGGGGGMVSCELLSHLRRHTMQQLPALSPRATANVLWAAARLARQRGEWEREGRRERQEQQEQEAFVAAAVQQLLPQVRRGTVGADVTARAAY